MADEQVLGILKRTTIEEKVAPAVWVMGSASLLYSLNVLGGSAPLGYIV